jgi:hypothetical protein
MPDTAIVHQHAAIGERVIWPRCAISLHVSSKECWCFQHLAADKPAQCHNATIATVPHDPLAVVRQRREEMFGGGHPWERA